MTTKLKIAPSILSANFGCLAAEVRAVEAAGADMIHVDVMDGLFVPNITIGPPVVEALRPVTQLPLDVHLMIDKPSRYIERFRDAGSDIITIHAEAEPDIPGTLAAIAAGGARRGVSLNPDSDLALITDYLDDIDMVLLMTVFPGFGGQSFIRDVLVKIEALRKIYDNDIEVDGGINNETVKDVAHAGANVIVAGSYVFNGDYKENINSLKSV